ncbi:MAG TPA: hypothetical protein VFN67_36370 [Polyangiales bacterium]|nr:hypothetical protein [Polyangiales bacterium]
MSYGPDHAYDDLATLVREQTDADAVVLIVAGGNRARHEARHAVQLKAASPVEAALMAQRQSRIRLQIQGWLCL